MVQEVEEVSAELRGETLAELPVFVDGEVPVLEARVPEDVAAHGAKCSRCRWGHNGVTIPIAAGRSQRNRIACVGHTERVASSRDIRCRISARLEIIRIAKEVPAVSSFTRLAQVVARVHPTPGLRAVEPHNRVQLPTREQLGKRMNAG